MESVSEERWLSLEEIAACLGIKRDTVYKWIDRKNMPAHKVGSLWKFKRVATVFSLSVDLVQKRF